MRARFISVTTSAMVAGAVWAIAPASAQSVSATCTTSVTCAAYTNSSTGVGIHGAANSGIGIRGTSVSNTGFYGASGSGSAGAPGIEGESTNGTGNDAAAAFGLAYLSGKPAPAYGAIAYGSAYGVFGETVSPGTSLSNGGYALFGLDGGPASAGTYDYNAGVVGRSTIGTGVLGEANGTPPTGEALFGSSPIGVYSVAYKNPMTLNANAFAFLGETDGFGLDLHNNGLNEVAYVLSPSSLFEATGASGSVSVDLKGNERLSGTLTTSKSTYVEANGASGTKMIEYASRVTTPQVEDVGEAQMTNGRAYVSVDARLADTIDRRVAYHVFITPEGDCKGLFVTQKSPAGFAVRELQGGRSSLAFEYRIVAKPVDEDGARLATAPAPQRMDDDGMRFARNGRAPAPAPLSPEARMKRDLGPQGYADAVAAIRKRSTGR